MWAYAVRPGTTTIITTMPTFRVKTPNHNTTVQADDYHTGSEGLDYYFKKDDRVVGSIPMENCEGIFEAGVVG